MILGVSSLSAMEECMTQFIVSFRGLNLSDDQVVRVRGALEKAMRREYDSLAARSDADVEWGSTDHDSREAMDKPGLPTVHPISYQPRAAR
jgi:hypothetical protein